MIRGSLILMILISESYLWAEFSESYHGKWTGGIFGTSPSWSELQYGLDVTISIPVS